MKTIKLTEEQLYDYMYCPAYFDMKYIKQLDIDERVTMPRLLEKISKYFYFQLFNNKIASPDELKKRWDTICNNNQDFITPQKNIEGIGLILKMFNWAAREKLLVLDISTPYKITVQNVELSGHIPVIIGTQDKNYEILFTNFSNRIPDQRQVDMSLKYTLSSYACKSIFDRRESGLKIHSVKYDKNILSQRTDDSYNRTETAIRNIGNGIINSIFYPREGIDCNTCGARQYCQYWFI